MRTQAFVGLILAVLVLIIGITMTETVVESVSDAIAVASGASDQPLTEVVLPFISTIYVAAVLGLAGTIGFVSVRTR